MTTSRPMFMSTPMPIPILVVMIMIMRLWLWLWLSILSPTSNTMTPESVYLPEVGSSL